MINTRTLPNCSQVNTLNPQWPFPPCGSNLTWIKGSGQTWNARDPGTFAQWKGVAFATVAALARPRADATHVLVYGSDGYTTNLPLEEALKDDVLLVHTAEGKPLPREHGGPVRMITPQLYAWKGSKWIKRIEFLTHDRPGFWETRGYSNTAHPWRDDRYS